MKRARPKNLPVSVHQRLLNLSREKGEEPNQIFLRYAIERFLYRLSQSQFRSSFILKGALLFFAWTGSAHRITRDLDLLGHGEASHDHIAKVFRAICRENVIADGLFYDPDSVRVQAIRDDAVYESHRVRLSCSLGTARFQVQIDVGFGDVVIPRATTLLYPGLLDFPEPELRAYPPETVVAEKLNALVALGLQNSRMKDFYDLWLIARTFSFKGPVLTQAIRGTFERRRIPLPNEQPVALDKQFAEYPGKAEQWRSFLERSDLTDAPQDLPELIETLSTFLAPPLLAATRRKEYNQVWQDGGPWREE